MKIFPSITATSYELRRAMPGDAIVPDPWFTVTHAITIDAPVDRVWPWLAQMGSLRGGWYSYDRIDNGGQPSTHRVIDAFQRIMPRDVQPALPGATDAFVVEALDPPRDLVLTVPGEGGPITSWEHLLEERGNERSRMILRGRVARGWKNLARGAGATDRPPVLIEHLYRVLGRLPDWLLIPVARLGHRWMEARHMRGIKSRAEAWGSPLPLPSTK
jgi:hypothetical protein